MQSIYNKNSNNLLLLYSYMYNTHFIILSTSVWIMCMSSSDYKLFKVSLIVALNSLSTPKDNADRVTIDAKRIT